MNFSANYFGHLPVNPDNLLDAVSIGAGSERPLGFSFTQIVKLFWGVRAFNINVGVQSQPNVSTGGIVSITDALNAVNTINQTLSNSNTVGIVGYTSISTTYKQEVRTAKFTKGRVLDPNAKDSDYFTWQGMKDGEFITSVRRKTAQELNEARSRGINSPLVFNNANVKEGNLCSGPIHKFRSGGGGVTIDLSSIVYRQRQYWPKILISFGNFSSLGSNGIQLIGGVNMLGGIVPLFMDYAYAYTVLYAIALGSVSIGARCGDRFYYDNADKIRAEKGCT